MFFPNKRKNILLLFIALSFMFFFPGCALKGKPQRPADVPALIKIALSEHPDFTDDINYDGLSHCIRKSLSYLKRAPSDRHFSFGEDRYNTAHMIKSLEVFLSFIRKKPFPEELKRFISKKFLVYKSSGGDKTEQVLFTGYYEPFLQGQPEKTAEYRFPVYARPEDLMTIDLTPFSSGLKGKKIIGRASNQTIVPYYNRGAIDYEGALEGKARILAWVQDLVDLFFLHIQGSGKILLGQDDIINVHYHTTNGRPYRSIGKLLIEEDKIPRAQMSMQKIREYLRKHPKEIKNILTHNPSYVFFKIEKDGPLGYLDVKLTPGRSIASDRRIFPLSALAFIEAKKPLTDGTGRIHEWIDMQRFALNQDVGGAIKGPGRADLFWGSGPYAEIAAGHMQHMGNLYFLVLRPDMS